MYICSTYLSIIAYTFGRLYTNRLFSIIYKVTVTLISQDSVYRSEIVKKKFLHHSNSLSYKLTINLSNQPKLILVY